MNTVEPIPDAVNTMTGWLRTLVSEHGDSEALVEPGGESVSFRALDHRVAELAGLLRSLGLERGDRLASFVPNSIFQLELLLAAARLGAVTVGVNTRYRASDLAHVLERARPRLMVSTRDFLDIDFPAVIGAAVDGLDCPPRVVWTHEAVGGRRTQPSVLDEGARLTDLLVAFTTSGTTGRPKLAAHDHATTVQHLRAVARSMRVGPGVTGLLILPFCGTFGFVSLLAMLAGGGRVVVPDHFDPSVAADLVDRYGVTHINGSDDMLLGIMDQGRACTTWRHGVQAEFTGHGAEVTARAEAIGARITGAYGSSETFALLARGLPDQPITARSRIGGVPVEPPREVRAVSGDTGTPLASGQVGELQIRGPSVLSAYLLDEGNVPPSLLPGGWFPTGDLGFVEPDGGFVHLTRMTDVLRLSGFLTDPAEIELHLMTHPSVTGAQVVGAPKADGGEMAVAFVVVAGDADKDALIDHCRRGLANYKVPAEIIVVDAFPMVDGANGAKVRKDVLRQRALAESPGPE